jgi:hypothetical protein
VKRGTPGASQKTPVAPVALVSETKQTTTDEQGGCRTACNPEAADSAVFRTDVRRRLAAGRCRIDNLRASANAPASDSRERIIGVLERAARQAGELDARLPDGRTGYAARPADPRSLAAAIHRALSADAATRERLRAAGRHLAAARYNHHQTVEAFLSARAPWAIRPVKISASQASTPPRAR